MSRVLITGASGWIGRALCASLNAQGHQVVGVLRSSVEPPTGIEAWSCAADDFVDLEHHWTASRPIDVVIHLAARVHAMREHGPLLRERYDQTNRQATLRVAALAARRGARRFVFLSSIKALGEHDSGTPLREDDAAHPADPYGESKYRAEQELSQVRDVEVVVVRPPLVYGPGVRANFRRLLDAVARGWILPLGRASAPRSLIALENLTDALRVCAFDERAAGHTFHVADAETLALRDLLTRIGTALGRPARLVAVPLPLLGVGAGLLGRRAELGRLTSSLRVDTSHIAKTLDWHAPRSVDQMLEDTARWYRSQRSL